MKEITMNQVKEILKSINPTFIDLEVATIKINNDGQVTVLNEENGNLVYTLENYTVVVKASVRVEFYDIENDKEYFKTFRAIKSDEQLDTKVNSWEDNSSHEIGCIYQIKLNNEWVNYSVNMWTI